MKDILKFSRDYDFKNVERLTDNLAEKNYHLFLESYFEGSDPKIFSHDMRSRKKRNDFFIDIKNFCNKKAFFKSSCYVENKLDVAVNAEALYDKIKASLTQCEISKYSISEQCWAHINRGIQEVDFIKSKSKKLLAEKVEKNGGVFTGDHKLIDEKGNEFHPDFVIEQAINALSLTLSMLGHEYKWFTDEGMVLPLKQDTSEDLCFKAGATQIFAIAWDKLENVANRCMNFGGNTLNLEGKRVPPDLRSKGLNQTVYFKPDFSEFEKAVFISSHRNIDLNTQIFYDAVFNSNVNKLVVSDISQITSLDDGLFLSENEATSLVSLTNVYCEDMFSSINEYMGLTVREWVRGYACLVYLINKSNSSNGYVYEEKQLIGIFVLGGLTEEKAYIALKLMLYGKKSRDLYDCPIIKITDGSYFLFHGTLTDISIHMALVSQFSNLNVEFKNKGFDFEKSVIEKLKESEVEVNSFQFKRGPDEYEYDAVFIMDSKVFVVECKNRSLPTWNPIRASRYKKFLGDCAGQVKRLVNGLLLYPDVFFDKFGKNINDYEVVPLIINCLPFSYPGKYNGVYYSDMSSLGVFFKSKNIHYKEYSGGGDGEVNDHVLCEQWLGDKPTSQDLINHLESPVQLKVYLNDIKEHGQWIPSSNDSAFMEFDLNVNLKNGIDEEFGVQRFQHNESNLNISKASNAVEPSSIKSNNRSHSSIKKSKRKIQKKSRKKNRKK